MIISSIRKAVWVPVTDDEPQDNLVLFVPERSRWVTMDQYQEEGGAFGRYQKYIDKRQKMGVDLDCNHNYGGLAHFWGNPEMEPPCKVVKIEDEWYIRRSCAHIPPVEEWES